MSRFPVHSIHDVTHLREWSALAEVVALGKLVDVALETLLRSGAWNVPLLWTCLSRTQKALQTVEAKDGPFHFDLKVEPTTKADGGVEWTIKDDELTFVNADDSES